MALRRAFLKTGEALVYPMVAPVTCHYLADFKTSRCRDGLSGKLPHRPMHLNTWFTLVGLFVEVTEILGGRNLLEDICHWGQTSRFCNLVTFPIAFLSSLYVDEM